MARKDGKKELTQQTFEASGTFLERGKEKKFTKLVFGFNERTARENLFALMGSKHKLKRRVIKINGIKLLEGK
ncbi:MAG: 50S ribosomal protein L18Ae [Candidatus Diapherotrites archaeon]